MARKKPATEQLQAIIEDAFERRATLSAAEIDGSTRPAVEDVIALLESGKDTRQIYVGYRNNAFDTHVFQNDLHQRLLTYTSDAISAFMQDLERIGTALRVDATRVGHHLDAPAHDLGQHRLHGDVHEVGGVAQLGFFQAGAGQQRHGEFGQVVEHQVVDLPGIDELWGAHHAVAPETRGAADADDAVLLCHVGLR